MSRSVRLYLQDIIDSIALIEGYAHDAVAFRTELMVQDAVFHRLAIIGEAAKHIPTRSAPRIRRWRGGRQPACATC